MLTEDELTELVGACAGAKCPILLTLSVVGRVALPQQSRWTLAWPPPSTPTSAG